MEHVPLGVFGEDPPEQLDRRQRGQLRNALRAEDLRRRLHEAKALIEANERN
ncbi:MAG: hypothetical protein ACPGVU_00070 [Limisphaerales bacterium]